MTGVQTCALPISYFHLLRWQALNPSHKPLVVFTPKSMLRLKAATSAVSEFTSGTFQPVLGDPASPDPADVRQVLLCSGKLFYELAERRAAAGVQHVALVRVERFYPLPVAEIAAELARYPQAREVSWVQEEPANMGAGPFVVLQLPPLISRPVGLISLPASPAPAAGSARAHALEHAGLIDAALGLGG